MKDEESLLMMMNKSKFSLEPRPVQIHTISKTKSFQGGLPALPPTKATTQDSIEELDNKCRRVWIICAATMHEKA